MKFLDITTSTVLLATLLLDQALACVEVYGGASTGIGSVDVVLCLKDNDENICDVHVGNSQVMNCKQGYWAWYYWGKIKDPIQIQYITPHGNYNFLLPNKHCESHDCCSADGACNCWDCDYDGYIYCKVEGDSLLDGNDTASIQDIVMTATKFGPAPTGLPFSA